jgi:DeoR/GlpR family transcriptional regulator of sugar metabolism
MIRNDTATAPPEEVFPVQRRQWILETLSKEGKILATSAADRLRVSVDTVRRDLAQLAQEGLLQRVHGGGLPISPSLAAAVDRVADSKHKKTRIAEKAALLIRAGMFVFMDGGTTNVELARTIDLRLRFTLVTPNPKAALVLAERGSLAEIILLGGRLDQHDLVTSDPRTLMEIGKFRADLYFMGICSLHPEIGLTCRTLEDRELKRAMAQGSAEVVGVAALEKLGTVAPIVLGPVTLLQSLVTEGESTKLDDYRRRGLTIF